MRAAAAIRHVERWDDTASRRDAWAAADVLCDELSAPVLVLNLLAEENSVRGGVLRMPGAVGEPCFLSVRQLLRTPPVFTKPETGSAVVYVCEIPSVAAANRRGARSTSLVGIDGQPRTATRLLLNHLTTGGIELRYHGDFDWPGIQIANPLMARHAGRPWRMSSEEYRRAATGMLALSGSPVAANWDDRFMNSMLELRRAVHEEQVLESLLHDLSNPQANRQTG